LKIVSIDDIAEKVDYGLTEKAKDEKIGPKFLRITDIQNNKVNWDTVPYCKCDEKEFEKNKLEAGDIVFARTGATTGKSFLVKNLAYKAVYASYLIRLRLNTDQVMPEFVSYFFTSDKYWHQIYADSDGATLPSFNATKLKALKIPLPSLSEQKAIVEKLDRAQRLIDIDKKMLAKYDELIQSVFLEMFGDPVTNPKGLKEKDFGELVDITGGYAFKSKNFLDDESGVKVVKIANVHFIDLDWSEVQYLPMESLKEHENYSLKEGDILLALTRPIINSLDAVKAVVVKESDLPALLNQRVARIRVDSDEVTEDYITSFIYTQHFKRQIEKYASTSLQPNVSNKEVSKIKVLVPEIDQQRKFSEIRQRILNERDALEMNQRKSEELFSSLVQGAFG